MNIQDYEEILTANGWEMIDEWPTLAKSRFRKDEKYLMVSSLGIREMRPNESAQMAINGHHIPI